MAELGIPNELSNIFNFIIYVAVTVINFFVKSAFQYFQQNISKIMIQSKLQKPAFKVDFTSFSNITNIPNQKSTGRELLQICLKFMVKIDNTIFSI